MCMKYVDANTTCYKSVTMDGDKIVSLNAPFEVIKSTSADGTSFIGDFFLITQIDFLGTNDPQHKQENPLEQKRTIDFIIRLTKCSKEQEHQCVDLDSFSINLEEMYKNHKVCTACFDFFNYTKITNVNKVVLNNDNDSVKYVIKVLIKDSEDTEYSIQSMTQLIIV